MTAFFNPRKISQVLEVPAIRIEQSRGQFVFAFAVEGRQILDFAAVNVAGRGPDAQLMGYQRMAISKHIGTIRRYLEGPAPMLPNAIVIALDKRVKYVAGRSIGKVGAGPGTVGVLRIPLGKQEDGTKVGFIVDGQQRVMAINAAQLTKFPVLVNAFISDNLEEQVLQFILLNSAKPLSSSLLYELVGGSKSLRKDAPLPPRLHRMRPAAYLVETLNLDPHSPFFGIIKTPTNPASGIVSDTAVLKMLNASLEAGALGDLAHDDPEGMKEHGIPMLFAYWSAVKMTFPEAWGLRPAKSRLMHGAGILAMGAVMDEIAGRCGTSCTEAFFRRELEKLEPFCAWTKGTWRFSKTNTRDWNQIQNTGKDAALLTNYLVDTYRTLPKRMRAA